MELSTTSCSRRCRHNAMLHTRCYVRRRGSPGPGPNGLPLFLEATQRKTERTAIAALRVDPIVVEVQEVGIGARNRRRPDVPAVADATQSTETAEISAVAVARGRGAPIFFDRAPRGTRRQDFSLNYSRKLRPKTCDSQQPRSKIARVAATPRGARCRSALENWSLLRQLPPCG